jgi:8-oxo-dGTP pyrophosphatase MutT (NUDIX family)
MLYLEKPKGFNPALEAVGCFVEYDGEILLLHRQDSRPQGNTWGIPSGRIDDGEQPLVAMQREIKEETGYVIPLSKISHFAKTYVRFSDYDFVYHIFHTRMNEKLEVQRNPREHKDARWISPNAALSMPLIQDLDACIKLFYKI